VIAKESMSTKGMSTISESELIDAIRNKAIKRFEILQNDEGKFRIIVHLSKTSVRSIWKEGALIVITTRNDPREWVSLDRLVTHIRTKYGAVPPISLTLNFDIPEK
jgi:hypothetical protein